MTNNDKITFIHEKKALMLERHHLSIIRAVIEYGTLTKAAEALFLSQSALSHTIKKLENHYGAPLWKKEGRNLRLTQAGQYLYRLAVTALPQFEHAEEQLRHFARGQSGILRIGMECHPCYQWLLKIVAPYLQDWQRVDVDVKQRFQFNGITALSNHEIDILITPDPVLGDGIIFIPVFPYEQVLVVAENHPLARKEMILPEDLAQETLISYPVPPERLDIFQLFLRPAHCDIATYKSSETTEIILQMVAAGRGITALPRWLIEAQTENIPLICRRLGNGIFKHIHIGVRAEDLETDYIAGFITAAEKHAQQG